MKKELSLFQIDSSESKFDELSNQIEVFIKHKNTPNDYKDFVSSIFKDTLSLLNDDPVWTFLSYLEKDTDYYTAPASTHFHGACECGLVRHSLFVLAKCLKLSNIMLDKDPDYYYLILSCLFHDLCKTNMYEIKLRNTKNAKTGIWEQAEFYKVRPDYLAQGHGIESVLRLNDFFKLPLSWSHAVRWHMGAYDLSESDSFSMQKAIAKYKEVLLLQTADMMAGIVEGI